MTTVTTWLGPVFMMCHFFFRFHDCLQIFPLLQPENPKLQMFFFPVRLSSVFFFFFSLTNAAVWSVPYLRCLYQTVCAQPPAPLRQQSPSQSHPGCHLQPAYVLPESVLEEVCVAAGSAGCDDLHRKEDQCETQHRDISRHIFSLFCWD